MKNVSVENKRLKIGMVLLLVLLLVFGSLIGIYVWKNLNTPKFKDDIGAKKGMLSNMSSNEIQNLLDQQVSDGYVNIFINSDPIFDDGETPGDIYIQNIPANKYGYRVTIDLKDTKENVMKTDFIKPGYNIENQRLSVDLDKGDYNAVARFICYESETDEIPISETDVNIVLHVKN